MENFKIIRQLGKGSFGEVSKVYRKTDKKIYALKKIQLRGVSRKEQQYALNEVRLLASLHHKNIIKFYEAFPDGRSCYSMSLCIVLEYAQGGDLDRLVKNHKKKATSIPEETIWSFASQIANGICFLHQSKILHRDIKAANCFLTHDGVVKIGDMNISRTIEKGQLVKTKMGTPYYMSPEILNNLPYDSKCDVWSFGCLVYELASLKYPFTGTSIYGLSKNICAGKYKHIPNNLYSKSIWRLIYSMLRVRPERRTTIENICLKTESHLKLPSHDPGWSDEKPLPIKLLRTIRMMPTVEQLTERLPKPRYDKITPLPNIYESPDKKIVQKISRRVSGISDQGKILNKPIPHPRPYSKFKSSRMDRLNKKYTGPIRSNVPPVLSRFDNKLPLDQYSNKPLGYRVDVNVGVELARKALPDNRNKQIHNNVEMAVGRVEKLAPRIKIEQCSNNVDFKQNKLPGCQEIHPIKIVPSYDKIQIPVNDNITKSPSKLKLPII